MLNFANRNAAKPIQEWRNLSKLRCVAKFASESECSGEGCGWDEFQQAPKRLDCLVCGGVGRVISFQEHPFLAIVNWLSDRFAYTPVAPGTELGDVMLDIALSEQWIIDRVVNEPRSFLLVDGKTVRPLSMSPNIVPQIVEGKLVSCKLFTSTNE